MFSVLISLQNYERQDKTLNKLTAKAVKLELCETTIRRCLLAISKELSAKYVCIWCEN